MERIGLGEEKYSIIPAFNTFAVHRIHDGDVIEYEINMVHGYGARTREYDATIEWKGNFRTERKVAFDLEPLLWNGEYAIEENDISNMELVFVGLLEHCKEFIAKQSPPVIATQPTEVEQPKP